MSEYLLEWHEPWMGEGVYDIITNNWHSREEVEQYANKLNKYLGDEMEASYLIVERRETK